MVDNYTPGIGDQAFQSLILATGDLVNNGNHESDWDDQFFATGYPNINEMLANVPYQACMGNHEGLGVLFEKYFPYPFVNVLDGRYWSFDYGPAHFAILDQYAVGGYQTGSPQHDWLEIDLANTGQPWKYIILHEPGWSAGGNGNNQDVIVYIQPLCEDYGVSTVFAGHNHFYSRAVNPVLTGVEHITTGGGGAPLVTPQSGWPFIVTYVDPPVHHFCKVTITCGQVMNLTAINVHGQVIDAFSIGTGIAALILTPYNLPIEIPADGGSFDYNIAVSNLLASYTTIDVWCDITLPDSTVFGPVLGPVSLVIPGGFSTNIDHTQDVPDRAPAGDYTFNGYVGIYPDTIWDQESFTFVKLDTGDGQWVDGWADSGEEFDQWLSEPVVEIPSSFALVEVYPNPFNPATTLSFALPKAAQVRLAVYDISGRQVTTLVNGWRYAGYHEVVFDGSNLSSGIYFYQLKTDLGVKTGRMLLLK